MATSGRLALVTGASSGIGAATAVALGAEGWRLILVARGLGALDQVAARVRAAGGQASVEAVDASDGEAVLKMAERVRAAWGVPEVLLNCAGAGAWKFIEDTPPAEAVAMLGAPYQAAYNVSHAFMADLLARGSGHLLYVGSPASHMPFPGATGYIVSRWALRALHEALCEDLRGTGLHSSHVLFGKVSSSYFENNPGSEERIPSIARLIPVMTPEQCARVLLQVIRRPRRVVAAPLMLRLFLLLERLAPRLVRRLASSTSTAKRPPRSPRPPAHS